MNNLKTYGMVKIPFNRIDLTFSSTEVRGWYTAGAIATVSCHIPDGQHTYVPYAYALTHHPDAVEKRHLVPYPYSFQASLTASLKPQQVKWVTHVCGVLERERTGVAQADTGSGKTLMSLAVAIRLRAKALIIVDADEAVEQFIEEILDKTTSTRDDIGVIKGRKYEYDKTWTIASIRTLVNRDCEDISKKFDILIWDEVQGSGAPKFSEAMSRINCRYVLGVSATPFRKDGLSPVTKAWFGPLVAQYKRSDSKVETRVVLRKTGYTSHYLDLTHRGQFRKDWMESKLAKDKARTQRIADHIREDVKTNKILVLSSRIAHLKELQKLNKDLGGFRFYPQKGVPLNRKRVKEGLKSNIIYATYKKCSKNVNIPDLTMVQLTMPVGDVTQIKGRVDRDFPGKTEAWIVDYQDKGLAPERLWRTRSRSYKKMRLEVSDAPKRAAKKVTKKATKKATKKVGTTGVVKAEIKNNRTKKVVRSWTEQIESIEGEGDWQVGVTTSKTVPLGVNTYRSLSFGGFINCPTTKENSEKDFNRLAKTLVSKVKSITEAALEAEAKKDEE